MIECIFAQSCVYYQTHSIHLKSVRYTFWDRLKHLSLLWFIAVHVCISSCVLSLSSLCATLILRDRLKPYFECAMLSCSRQTASQRDVSETISTLPNNKLYNIGFQSVTHDISTEFFVHKIHALASVSSKDQLWRGRYNVCACIW